MKEHPKERVKSPLWWLHGIRKMRWNCIKSGCAETYLRLKLGVFDRCFHGRVGMTDIDAAVEVNGNMLIQEWKAEEGKFNLGQELMAKKITECAPIMWVNVVGKASSMECSKIAIWLYGKRYPEKGFMAASTERLFRLCTAWDIASLRNPASAITENKAFTNILGPWLGK